MVNIFDVQENKVTTNLNGYSMVWMGLTGEGKTDSLNRVLKSIAEGNKKPLFLMFEDRYQHIPNIMAIRIRSVAEFEAVKNQLKSPKAKELYSCIVIDTADKLDVMMENYVAVSKEVEISGELKFGAGNKYIKSKLFIIDELRNSGWNVHFLMQSYENTNIITQETKYDFKLNKETWAKISHDAYLIGLLRKDPNSNERIITFTKSSTCPNLKDSIGMPQYVKISEFKETLEKAILNIEGAEFTSDDTINHEIVEEIPFDKIVDRGTELGGILASAGHLEEALHILKLNIGQNEDGSPKMFDTLLPTQVDLAKVVVLKLEALVQQYGLKDK